ncbi:hypothetical protein MHBO_002643 [Bonamia ostreae]|uniref:Uncharacterized protein n=1 Tax=Bonamia ostreae TaxID=126728 RepID=A0ABV2AN04_9EUKA
MGDNNAIKEEDCTLFCKENFSGFVNAICGDEGIFVIEGRCSREPDGSDIVRQKLEPEKIEDGAKIGEPKLGSDLNDGELD